MIHAVDEVNLIFKHYNNQIIITNHKDTHAVFCILLLLLC
jgi:hypothetical protein